MSHEAVYGRGYKAAGAPIGAYVRCTTVADGASPCTMYDVRFGNSRALRADLAKFAVMLAYFFIHSKRTRNELNESREDFIGTRVLKMRLP